MNKGIGRKILIRYEQCLKEEEKTSQLAFSRKQKHLRLAFLPLLLSRTVYASLEVIWNVFAAEKFERIMCIQLYIIQYVHRLYTRMFKLRVTEVSVKTYC